MLILRATLLSGHYTFGYRRYTHKIFFSSISAEIRGEKKIPSLAEIISATQKENVKPLNKPDMFMAWDSFAASFLLRQWQAWKKDADRGCNEQEWR